MHKYFAKQVLLTLLFTIPTIFYCSLKAQPKINVYIHLIGLDPLESNLRWGYKYGAGGEGSLGLALSKHTVVTGTLGYTLFKHSDNYVHDGITYVPVKLGVRQYLFAKKLFAHADAGLGIVSLVDEPGNKAHFSGDLGMGIKFSRFEILVDYDGFTESTPDRYASWVAIKAGFSFGL